MMPVFDAILIGHDSLTREAGRMLIESGHRIRAVVTRSDAVRDWAAGAGLALHAPGPGLADQLPGVDWLLSIANLDLLGADILARARRGAVNFHDGPLPAYAGLNAPAWAILNGATKHGITWHLIAEGIDSGPILDQRLFPIEPDETTLSLNGKCFAAALESFPDLVAQLAGTPKPVAQDSAQRSYFARDRRPDHGGRLDFTASAAEILRLVRGLDHGDYPNPLVTPQIVLKDRWFSVGRAGSASGEGVPGLVLGADDGGLTIAVGDGALRLSGLRDRRGHPPRPEDLPAPGTVLSGPAGGEAADLARGLPNEGYWRQIWRDLRPVPAPALGGTPGTADLAEDFALDLPPDAALTRFAAMIIEGAEDGIGDFAFATGESGLLSDHVPLRFDNEAGFAAALATARTRAACPGDLPQRLGTLPPELTIALSDRPEDGLLDGSILTFAAADGGARLTACPARISPAAFALLSARLKHRLAGGTGLSPKDRALITAANATDQPVAATPIHDLIAARAAQSPMATALIFEDRAISYAQLDSAANALAHRLVALGVRPGMPVGLYLHRSEWLVIAALAIWKAGGAYLPLDPAYPADRIALYIEDSGTSVIVTDADLAATLPPQGAEVLILDRSLSGAAEPPVTAVQPGDLAYLIYTSGSTGRPKGVMIEHAQLANFLIGMDGRIVHDPPGTWLAVTSLSFDISVLELFWTLARGFRTVIAGDEDRALVARGSAGTGPGMEFSLYYWGNDDGIGRDKYRLLLDGARFADANGFRAIWTPERHFHAFGGPYPNPAVTGAAVAAVTRNLDIRAGSCVAPLHHPARIAEEWAVIDNLTNGRAGLALASGWQPDDFVLRPENAPPRNKPALFTTIEQLRRLWAGEAVDFPDDRGGSHAVQTQPRPVNPHLPLWVTTAGNPDTWREAGAIGANVLTHLLGQSIAEVGEKITLYHDALRAAGHDPAQHRVTLMLHTFLAETREEAREIARAPMKDYLRSAAGLIRQYAWAFPAFKRPEGGAAPEDIDLSTLAPEEMEAILDFAFLRYFDDSGLFGTVEDALARTAQLQAIGVTEIACLIDYGIETSQVLAGLEPLADVVRQVSHAAGPAVDDFSLAAQIQRHGVTHLQCTPAMARMLVTNDDSRAALKGVKHLLIGGEALPGALVADLRAASPASITNMYGPTETTIWSTTAPATSAEASGPVGTPIANTKVHVLDAAMRPVAPGIAGDLWIGGAGVARGYWQRPDLTEENFRPDPFHPGGRIYRTGDLARWRADGSLDFLGRADHQVKLRGYRIELGEIEAALDACPGIRQSVVIPREDVPGVQQLVAYVLADQADEAGLKAELARTLPPQMIPARILRLDALPLTPNRKVDRKALPAPGPLRRPVAEPVPEAVPKGPAGPAPADLQPRIAAIWSRLLGVEGIGPEDSFFDLGGHSLLAVQAHRDLRDGLGAAHLTITDIFRFPSLRALTARIAAGFAPPAAAQTPAPVPADDTRAEAMERRRAMRARRGAG